MCGIAPSIRVPAFQKTVEALPNRGSTTVSAACSRCKDATSSLFAVSANARRDDEILAWAQAPILGKALPGDGWSVAAPRPSSGAESALAMPPEAS